MSIIILLLPLFLIRYGIPKIINKNNKSNISYFTPMIGLEKFMYILYQLSTIGIIITMIFLKIDVNSKIFKIGIIVYIFGIILFVLSVYSFEKYSDGICKNGIYKFSRNPMYIGYFIYFIGCSLLTKSFLLFIFTLIFQISSHWIILSEERYCIKIYGEEYINYMKEVRRYI